MSRPLRIKYPGAVYHITARGNRRGDIFLDDRDRKIFLKKLSRVIENHNWLCHAYCLMTNHYHLLIETIEANISEGMRDLNKAYSQTFNRLHETVGHLLQGRFKGFIIEKPLYLLEVARYGVLNPVRAGIVEDPSRWPWSSFRATVGMVPSPTFLTTDWILGQFGNDRAKSQQAYSQFVLDGIASRSPFDDVSHRFILGSPQFVSDMWKQCKDSSEIHDISREERLVGRPSLEELFPRSQTKNERNQAIVFARVGCGYSVSQIARFLHVSHALVSKISNEMWKSNR